MMKKRYYILLAFYFLNGLVFGQTDRRQYFDIDAIGSKELIKSIGKDADGYIWLATDQGIVRFDGLETQNFYKEFPTPYTKAFLTTRSGRFYILYDSGIKEIVNEQGSAVFKPVIAGDQNMDQGLSFPKSIYEDSKGNIWIGEFNSVVRINETGVKRFTLGEAFQSINYHRSFSFAEDAFGTLWIAPYKGELLTYDHIKDTLQAAGIQYRLTNVSAIAAVRGDYLLVAGKEGVARMRVDSDRNIRMVDFIDEVKDISTAVCINDQYVYLGSWTNGLYRLDFNTSFVETLEPPLFSDILDFEYDSQNNELWVAGSENVGLFRKANLIAIKEVGETRIESVSAGESGTLYYSVGQQLFRLTGKDGHMQVEEVLSSKDTYFDRILSDGDTLWIGDAFGSISSFDMKTGALHAFRGNSGYSVQHIFMDGQGNKWFSGNADELIRVDRNQTLKGYPVRYSSVVRESPGGEVIAGTLGRDSLLFRYNREQDIFTPLKLSFSFDLPDEDIQVEDIGFDADQNLYMATDIGLLKTYYGNGSYSKTERVTMDGFEENEPSRAIAISGESIWIANSSGLVALRDGNATFFSIASGLPSRIIKERGLLINEEGNLLIATAKGLASIDATSREFPKTSKPVFKSIAINGKMYNSQAEGAVKLPYRTKLHADYMSLSYPGTDLAYQSRILGLDDTWSKASQNHTFSALGFTEGEYTLQVRARSGGHDWSEPLTFSFVVSNPWYRAWWAYALFVMSLGLFTYIAIKIYSKNLIRQKKKLQRIIEARTAEINRQKNEIIDQKNKIIQQKEELLEKNRAVYESQKALTEADLKYLHLKEKQLQDQIDFKNKQITTHTLNIIQKNTSLKELRNRLEEISRSQNGTVHAELKRSLRIIDESFKLDKDWEDFKLFFEQVYTGFYAKLKVNYPELTTLELRHCALIRLNLSISECASILGISHDSIKVSRTRLRKKLKIQNNGSLADFILSM